MRSKKLEQKQGDEALSVERMDEWRDTEVKDGSCGGSVNRSKNGKSETLVRVNMLKCQKCMYKLN